MGVLKLFRSFLLLSLCGLILSVSTQAEELPHKLAVGTTYIGAQLHWGFAERWALELRTLKDKEQDSSAGTVTGYAYGARGYWYFRKPTRVRFYLGMEGAATRSYSSTYDYKATGFAMGGFGGTEMYLLKRLSVGVDIGPYLLSTKVRNSQTSEGEVDIVINSFMNFYFL